MAKQPVSVFSPLPQYNLLSACGWGYILYNVITVFPMVGQPQFFEQTKDTVTIVQCFAIIEIVNSLLGIVRSPIVTTVAQVASRLLVVVGIFQYLPEAPGTESYAYITLLLAWSITEIVRYLYYFCMLVYAEGTPTILILLRYNLFWVLYPTGVASELFIIYSALSVAETKYSPLYKWVLIGSMITYLPGLPTLFLHMVAQRKKVMKSLREDASKKKKN
ncbi:hypothetical protein NCAS_0A09490 [Naumovozyma castellii]|uniref:Very-long-chain (3R)-3-hydroxyacyl-CoA dehydratase n=1 Tax=Naumovozyma castellii TaxID=27288 RepID=G0V7Q9_NAUCA|nr:hypothetical protein NCAS_0A09490 [Naumovozyma castellii CBS 4309]CCC67507.1 hypothetical protein NCAS_0A09490 [Naumovozyma castellii CBS 4309]